MGIFNKKQNQENYIALVRKTAEEALGGDPLLAPSATGYNITLTTASRSIIEGMGNNASYLLKTVTAKLAGGLVGLHVHNRENPFSQIVFITCFCDSEIYFFSIGDGMNKSFLQVDTEQCFRFSRSEIESIKTGLGKKVTLMLTSGQKFSFSYGVGAGTIYNLTEGDKQFAEYIKSF